MGILCCKVRQPSLELGMYVMKYGKGYYVLPTEHLESLGKNNFAIRESRNLRRILLYFTLTCLASYVRKDRSIAVESITSVFPYISIPLLKEALILLEKRKYIERGDALKAYWVREEYRNLLATEHSFLYNFAKGSPVMMGITSGLKEVFDVTMVDTVPLVHNYKLIMELFHSKRFLEDGRERNFLSFISKEVEGVLGYYLMSLSKMVDEIGMLPQGKRGLLEYIAKLPLEGNSDNAVALGNLVNSISNKIESNHVRKELYKLDNSSERLVVLDGSSVSTVGALLHELRSRDILVEYIDQNRRIMVVNPKVGKVSGALVVEHLKSWLVGQKEGTISLGTGFIEYSGYQLDTKEFDKILSMSKALLQNYGFLEKGNSGIRRYRIDKSPHGLLELVVISELSVLD